jgi:hypothetical protein
MEQPLLGVANFTVSLPITSVFFFYTRNTATRWANEVRSALCVASTASLAGPSD